MDLAILITLIATCLATVGITFGMMFWSRTEANEIRKDQKEDRKDMLEMVRSIQWEMKDFHRRLEEIERSRKT